MKHFTVKGLPDNHVAYTLPGGEHVVVKTTVTDGPGPNVHDIQLQGWQIAKDGARYVDPDDGSAVIIPVKTRRVQLAPGGPTLDDEIADAQVAFVDRLQQHITARAAIKKVRAARAVAALTDPDRDII